MAERRVRATRWPSPPSTRMQQLDDDGAMAAVVDMVHRVGPEAGGR
ncbi:MAG: hypothetical protein ACRDT0_06190 [Pseudonocardiaceae bacterium]